MFYRLLAALPGVPLLMIAIMLIFQPEQALNNLGMPLMEGAGLSSQLGDLTSFFLCTSIMCFLGAWLQNAQWLYGAVMFLIAVAVFRTLAWAVHGAEFATAEIIAEVVMATLLLVCAKRFSADSA